MINTTLAAIKQLLVDRYTAADYGYAPYLSLVPIDLGNTPMDFSFPAVSLAYSGDWQPPEQITTARLRVYPEFQITAVTDSSSDSVASRQDAGVVINQINDNLTLLLYRAELTSGDGTAIDNDPLDIHARELFEIQTKNDASLTAIVLTVRTGIELRLTAASEPFVGIDANLTQPVPPADHGDDISTSVTLAQS